MDASNPDTQGMEKFTKLMSTLDLKDAAIFFEAKAILAGEEISPNDALILMNNAHKLKKIIQSLILTQINSIRMQPHDRQIIFRFMIDLEKISNICGLAMVADQVEIDRMEHEFRQKPQGNHTG
jgi:hypothetical protein